MQRQPCTCTAHVVCTACRTWQQAHVTQGKVRPQPTGITRATIRACAECGAAFTGVHNRVVCSAACKRKRTNTRYYSRRVALRTEGYCIACHLWPAAQGHTRCVDCLEHRRVVRGDD